MNHQRVRLCVINYSQNAWLGTMFSFFMVARSRGFALYLYGITGSMSSDLYSVRDLVRAPAVMNVQADAGIVL